MLEVVFDEEIIMTKKEAAIVAAYTGYLIGAFSDMHEYVEQIMERPIFTHEMASQQLMNEIRARSKQDFVSIKVE